MINFYNFYKSTIIISTSNVLTIFEAPLVSSSSIDITKHVPSNIVKMLAQWTAKGCDFSLMVVKIRDYHNTNLVKDATNRILAQIPGAQTVKGWPTNLMHQTKIFAVWNRMWFLEYTKVAGYETCTTEIMATVLGNCVNLITFIIIIYNV
jgi:hypothetical protein